MRSRKREPPREVIAGRLFHFCDGSGLDLVDVRSLRTLRLVDDVELDLIALGQRLEAIALDRAEMNEAVLAAVLRRDESKTLGIIEPLHSALRTHCRNPLSV